jgi:RHS repeat-associated protein
MVKPGKTREHERVGHPPYDVAGNMTNDAANTTTKWGFTTYERDAESDNDYAMAREYVNRLGRFNAPDPLGGSVPDPQSLDRYAYARNDPVNNLDPTGQQFGYANLAAPPRATLILGSLGRLSSQVGNIFSVTKLP